MRRRNAVAVLYLILTFIMAASVPLLQRISWLRNSILVIAGAAFMFLTIGVVTYLMIFPKVAPEEEHEFNREEGSSKAFEAVLKVLREDEKKVCEAIWKEGGTVLQKDVRWMTGLSKVRTYRVGKSLASRGIITVSKDGRLNRLSLAPWLYGNTTDKNQ